MGVDGQAEEDYAVDLEGNPRSLLDRAKSGRYQAPTVRRVHMPKGTGSETRPIGIPTFEDKILQRAVGLNVIEQWNGANDFVFFARRGGLASNRHEDHEVRMPALHLLQNCMIYINTLMLQKFLAQRHWTQKLEPRDLSALTSLIWERVNPYGRFEIDMNVRLPLD